MYPFFYVSSFQISFLTIESLFNRVFLEFQGQRMGCREGMGNLKSYHWSGPQSTAWKPFLDFLTPIHRYWGKEPQSGTPRLDHIASLECLHWTVLWPNTIIPHFGRPCKKVLGNGYNIYYKDIVKNIVYLVLHLLWENPKEKIFPVLCTRNRLNSSGLMLCFSLMNAVIHHSLFGLATRKLKKKLCRPHGRCFLN